MAVTGKGHQTLALFYAQLCLFCLEDLFKHQRIHLLIALAVLAALDLTLYLSEHHQWFVLLRIVVSLIWSHPNPQHANHHYHPLTVLIPVLPQAILTYFWQKYNHFSEHTTILLLIDFISTDLFRSVTCTFHIHSEQACMKSLLYLFHLPCSQIR